MIVDGPDEDLEAAPEPARRLEAAVRADLERWELVDTSLAAATLDIVDRLANPRLSDSAAALLHQRLDTYLSHLRKLAPAEVAEDDITDLQDELAERRRAAGLG